MFSQTHIHDLTDRIAKYYSLIIENIGFQQTESPSSVDTIQKSLWDIRENVLSASNDTDVMASIGNLVKFTERRLDASLLARNFFASIIGAIENNIRNGSRYDGFSAFAIENSGTRYASTFVRLLYELGYTLLVDTYCFFDSADTIGSFAVSGAGQGTWTFESDYKPDSDLYGVQPSTTIQAVADGLIGGSDIVITAVGIEPLNDTTIELTATIPAASADGTAVEFSGGGGFSDYIYDIKSVQISGGTAADAFDVKYKPIRTIALS